MTTQEYFDKLKSELQNFAELQAIASEVNTSQELLEKITTDSQVAVWDLMTWVQATGCATVDIQVRNTLEMIADILDKRRYGHTGWYVEQAKLFQFGSTITWQNGRYFYQVVDASQRIVKQAAISKIPMGLRLKVAKPNGENLQPLNSQELIALTNYFNDDQIGIKPAGVYLQITSSVADLLKLLVRIVINPQVLSAQGFLLSNPAVFPVEDAINQFIKSIPFDGILNMSHLEDALQSVEGVEDVEIDSAQAKYGALGYQDIDLSYKPDAGYLQIDPAFPLNTSIQYLHV